jgi:YVTN family beta-propeller protein
MKISLTSHIASSITSLILILLSISLSTISYYNIPKKANADSVIATITVGTGPYGDLFNPANGYVYVANVFSHSVSVIDPQKNTVITTITEPTGQTPRELAYDSTNGFIYVADVYSNTVSVIDGKTNTLVTSIPTGGSITDGVAFDPNNGFIYAVNAGSGTVSVIDGSTNKVVGTIPVGTNPLEDVYVPTNGYIYVANEGSGTVSIIDGKTNAVIGTITGVSDPVQLEFNSGNGYIYVAGHNSNSVTIIDSRTNTVIGAITGPQDPTGVGYNSANGNMYVGNQGSNYVSVIDGKTNKVIDSIIVGKGPVSPVFDPNNGNMFVTDFNSNESPGNTVSVISTASAQQDTIPPDTVITSAIDGNNAAVLNGASTFSTSIKIAFTGTDNVAIAGFECSLDSSLFSRCTSPAVINNLATGIQHNFQVRAIDTSGNRDPTPASLSWTILTPAQGLQQLIQLIQTLNLNRGVQASLTSMLNAALSVLTDNNQNNDRAACPLLNSFTQLVNVYLHTGQITASQAAQLIQSAQNIKTAQHCNG